MSVHIDDPERLNGTAVVGDDGRKLGSVDAVYYDNATDRPQWVAVRSGLFGTRVTLVPLRRADYAEDELRVPFDKARLKNAPHHDPGRELSSSDEADLYRYYGIDYDVVDPTVTDRTVTDRTATDRTATDRAGTDRDVVDNAAVQTQEFAIDDHDRAVPTSGTAGAGVEEHITFDRLDSAVESAGADSARESAGASAVETADGHRNH